MYWRTNSSFHRLLFLIIGCRCMCRDLHGFSAFIDTFIDSFASLQFLLFTINRVLFYPDASIHVYGLKYRIYL